MNRKLCTLVLLWAWCLSAIAQQYDPGSGNTLLLVGQTFQTEYDGYKSGTGLTPAGSSHYATFYLGQIEQGDDDPNAAFLDYVRGTQSDPYALIALSFKDNTAAGGYGQMTDDSQPLNTNAVWDALTDISAGAWDDQIDDFAAIMNSRTDTKFYVRIGYEVSLLLFGYNGSQYVVDWLNQQAGQGINVFDDPDAIANMDRQAYINAYNYIANRLRNVNGVTNVDFVYHPVRGFNDTRWLYPGPQYVDWVAFSVFNNDVCVEVNGTFNCQGDFIDPQLQQSIDFAKQNGHEIMIAEAAVQAPAASSPSAFNDYLDRLHNVVVDNDVRVLAYINSDWPSQGWGPEWGDSRVETNATVRNHWLSLYGSGSRYIHAGGSTTPTPTCSDGIQNGNETGVDCGGSCPDTCPPDPGGGTDCAGSCPSGYSFFLCGQCWVDEAQAVSGGCTETCSGGGNPTPTCSDGIQNGDETGVDCGGSCPRACSPDAGGDGDCAGSCPQGYSLFLCGQCWVDEAQALSAGCTETCNSGGGPTPTCTDGIQNGDETGVDCGGSCPNACPIVPTCTDGVQNGNETGIDCGGSCPNTCPTTPTCTDGIRNGDETGIDCGGSCPNMCPPPTSGDVAFLQPTNGDKLLFIGQDLLSVSEYISQCAGCPTPAGTTTYVTLAGVLTGGFYGALGYTEAKQPFGVDVDWGGGPLNAYSNAIGFPNSTVQIGLYLVDQLGQINSGALDNQIGHMGDYFKAFPNTAFYLRVGYEFDGAWNAYNQTSYINAYRRLVDILRANGVNNVAYVWQSSTSPIDDIIDGGQEPLLAYYPGDNYVDWFGMSWFLRPDEQATVGGTITTQRQLADELVALARNRNKPVMICEAAPQGYDIGGGSNSNISTVWDGGSGGNTVSKSGTQIWNEWFQPFFNYIYANDDVIKGVTLINADWDAQGLWDPPYEQGYWGDSRIQANTTVENNWVNEITKSGWLHGSPTINSALNWSAPAARGGESGEVDIESELDKPSLSLYPNPAADRLHLTHVDDQAEFSIFDSRGIKVLQGKGHEIDVRSLKSGLYIVYSQNTRLRFVKR